MPTDYHCRLMLRRHRHNVTAQDHKTMKQLQAKYVKFC